MTSVSKHIPEPPKGSVGQRVGSWTLAVRLGAGASGETWRATRADGMVAAVKLMSIPPAAELRALAQLCHPAIPGLVESAGGAPWFLAMELAPGVPLTAALQQGRLPRKQWMRGMVGLFDALATVHALGLRHGDIKPDNILWQAHSPVPARLVDFGLCEEEGGTATWAAPEHLAGRPATAASDVYVMGLVAWHGLCGARPHPARSVGEAIALRCRTAPTPPTHAGPAWLRELLQAILDPDPARRPSAAAVVDAFGAGGLQPPAVDGALVRRRARRARVSRRSVDGPVRAWVRRGGHLVLTGPRGCGRRRTAEQVAVEVWSLGRAAVSLSVATEAWGSVEAALATLGVALPVAPDDVTRVRRAAEAIEAAETAVIVGDYDGLDSQSRAVVDRLAEGPTPLLVSAEVRPAWARSAVALGHCDGEEVGGYLRALLGNGADRPGTRRVLWRATRGLAGDLVDLVVAAVDCGAFTRSGESWVLDESRLPADGGKSAGADLPPVGTSAAEVAAALAWIRRPVLPAWIAGTLGWTVDAVSYVAAELVSTGHAVWGSGVLQLRPGIAAAIRANAAAFPFDCSAALAWARSGDVTDPAVLAWLAVGVGDSAKVARYVPPAVRWWTPRNPHLAARLADAAWEVAPDARLAVPRMDALLSAGHVARARTAGEAALSAKSASAQPRAVAAAMVGMADLEANHGGSPDAALEWCTRARKQLEGQDLIPDSLCLAEAQAHSLLGEHRQARDLVLAIAQRPPPAEGVAAGPWLRARTLAAQSMHRLGEGNEAIELLESIPDDCGLGLAERAVSRAALGRLLWFAGQLRRADAAMTEAGRSDGGLKMLDRARLLNNLGAVRHHSGSRAEAVAAWEQALILFRRLDAKVEAVRTLSNLCVGYKELGRWERARQAGVNAVERATTLGAVDLQCHAALNLAELHLSRGQLTEAEVRLKEALGHANAGGLDREKIEARLRVLELELVQGRGGVEARAVGVRDDALQANMVVEASLAGALAALACARAGGTPSTVDAYISGAVEPLQAAGAAADLARVRIWIAEALMVLDRPAEAAVEVDRARAFARERGNVPLMEQAEALEARLAEAGKSGSRDRRIDKLVSVAVAINEQADLRHVFDHIAEAGLELLGGDRAFVLTGDPPQVVGAVTRGVARGQPSMSVVRQAIADRREVIAADVDERGDLRDLHSVAALELRSVVCVPMAHHNEVIGAIYVDSQTATQEHLWESAELMRGLAAMAAVAVVKMRYFEETVQQARMAAQLAERERVARELADKNEQLEALNRKLRASAITDPLTGIGNRRHMVETLASAFETAAQGGPAFSIVVADIDHFKRINDTWGHQVGDRVIAEVAGRIGRVLRGGDRVFRYGGEELVILSLATTPAALREVCERVRLALADRPMPMADDREHTVTVSVGASALLAGKDARWEEILQRADAALYGAKARGRNQSVLSSDLETQAVDSVA